MLLSGGIDSATCVRVMGSKCHLRALTFEYRGMARRELDAARRIAQEAGIREQRLVRLPDLREAGDIGGEAFAGAPKTFIPMRNAVFYALAASYAEEVEADLIVGGHNRDDFKIFADATPAFFGQLQKAFRQASPTLRRRDLRILLPLSGKTKAQVVRLATSLKVPLELTWSCHRGHPRHCWECDGCRARMAAFEKAGVVDPLRNPGRLGKIS